MAKSISCLTGSSVTHSCGFTGNAGSTWGMNSSVRKAVRPCGVTVISRMARSSSPARTIAALRTTLRIVCTVDSFQVPAERLRRAIDTAIPALTLNRVEWYSSQDTSVVSPYVVPRQETLHNPASRRKPVCRTRSPRVDTSDETGAILVAAGASRRMDGADKIFAPLLRRPLLTYQPLCTQPLLLRRCHRPRAGRELPATWSKTDALRRMAQADRRLRRRQAAAGLSAARTGPSPPVRVGRRSRWGEAAPG